MDRNGLTEDRGINQNVSPECKTCGGRSFQQQQNLGMRERCYLSFVQSTQG
jgi:hypothetical protein